MFETWDSSITVAFENDESVFYKNHSIEWNSDYGTYLILRQLMNGEYMHTGLHGESLKECIEIIDGENTRKENDNV